MTCKPANYIIKFKKKWLPQNIDIVSTTNTIA